MAKNSPNISVSSLLDLPFVNSDGEKPKLDSYITKKFHSVENKRVVNELILDNVDEITAPTDILKEEVKFYGNIYISKTYPGCEQGMPGRFRPTLFFHSRH